jgi:hypothetical protein
MRIIQAEAVVLMAAITKMRHNSEEKHEEVRRMIEGLSNKTASDEASMV